MKIKRIIYLLTRFLQRVDKVVIVEMKPDPEVGDGFIWVDKHELLRAAGLPESFQVTGVKWSFINENLKITVRSEEIPKVGGEIVKTNPIHTEKEIRDALRLQKAAQDSSEA